MDGRTDGKAAGSEREHQYALIIDCAFPFRGLLDVPLKNSKATGSKTHALPKRDTCSSKPGKAWKPA